MEKDPKKDKTVVASYKFVANKNGMNIYGNRMLTLICAAAQGELQGLSFRDGKDMRKIDIKSETNLWGEHELTMNLRDIVPGTHNFTREIRESILSLGKATIVWEDEDSLNARAFLAGIRIEKNSLDVKAFVSEKTWEILMDFSDGFKKFSLTKALSMRSVYSLRLYQLISLQTDPITYNIDDLRAMFHLEKKYAALSTFLDKVINTAKKELDEVAPYTFDYTLNYTKKGVGRPQVTSITFKPKYQAKNDTEQAMFEDLQAKYPGVSLVLDYKRVQYLVHKFGITKKGIENNRRIFQAALKHLDYDAEVERIAEFSDKRRPKNPAGYLVLSLKTRLMEAGVDMEGEDKKAEKSRTNGSREVGGVAQEVANKLKGN